MLRHNGNDNGDPPDVGAKTEQSQAQPSLASETPLLLSHIHAVNTSAVTFAILFGSKMLAEGASSSVPFPARVWSFAIPVLIMAGFFWVVAFLAALPAVALARATARRFKIRNIVYYLACGALTGLVLTPLYVLIGPQQSWQNEQNFSEDCITWGPIFIACGACGAITFWLKAGRHIGQAAEPQPTHHSLQL